MTERRRRISDIIPSVQVDDRTAASPPEDNRRSGRVALNAEVTFLQPAHATGIALDANRTGMRVRVDAPIEVGARCIALVQLEDGSETHERAEVVWAERSDGGWVVGLKFAS